MRLENETPATTIERTIENILTNNGIKATGIVTGKQIGRAHV